MKNTIIQNEYLELKGMISNLTSMVQMLIPQKASVSYLSETTGRSRQGIRNFLINNFEPEVDYWVENGKMFASQGAAITILTRSSK